jgi:hypothetical protein
LLDPLTVAIPESIAYQARNKIYARLQQSLTSP